MVDTRPAIQRVLSVALALVLVACAADSGPSETPEISLELCVLEDGTATDTWTTGITGFVGEDSAEALAEIHLPLTPAAHAWFDVLRSSLPGVADRATALADLFDMEPLSVTIAAGNRGSSDGFGWGERSIGINLQAFSDTYGPPDSGALDRMSRIVAHEYVHLMTYAYYPNHRELRDTPFNRAVWTMFFEGLGDYISVSQRWLPDERGHYSEVTERTLERLEPIFVERLEALVTASPDEEEALRAGISMGKFDEKWGSLPVALWLHSEARHCGKRATEQALIRLGPDAVLPLAIRHAHPELRPRLRELARLGQAKVPEGGAAHGGCLSDLLR